MNGGAWPSILTPASEQGSLQAEVAWVVIVGAGVVFALTMGLLLAAWRRPFPLPRAGWWIWAGGLAWPVATLAALGIYAFQRGAAADAEAAGAPLVIGVTGHMWWWDVRVHDGVSDRVVRLANELHLPADTPVQLGLGSADVIHSFWVPELGGKVDMVPGRTHAWRVLARRPGVYRGQCAEHCGTQHARMALRVVVHTPEAYARWLAREAAPARHPQEALAQQGRHVFLTQGCAACHAIRGVAETGRLGPDLTHVASRMTLGAGTLRNRPGAMAAWLTGVQALKPSAHMPAFAHLDAATLNALGAYLSQLQ